MVGRLFFKRLLSQHLISREQEKRNFKHRESAGEGNRDIMTFQNISYDLNNLPVMPEVAMETIKLINSQDSSAEKLAEVVSRDPVVMARVLKIANSSFYSMSRQVTSLSKAIVILGEKTLRNLVLAASMHGMHRSFGPVEKMLWEDSLICALASRFVADKLSLVDPEEAFLAGLFRHIGKVVLSTQSGHELVAELVTEESAETLAKEKEVFGANHAEIGAAALERWQLSRLLSLVTLHHSDAGLTGVEDPETIKMICLINITNLVPAAFGVFGTPQQFDFEALPGVQQLNLDGERLAELLKEFKVIFVGSKAAFFN